MKKNIIALAVIAAMAASVTGCKKAEENKKSSIVDGTNAVTTAAPAADGEAVTAEPKTEEQIKEELENFAKDADKNADTDKIDGSDLKGSDSEKKDFEGFEVEIKKAVKTQDADGAPVVVVEFSFKNRTSQPAKFASVIKDNAAQGERVLPPALTYEAEGFEPMTIAQDVDTNDSITVQKAYKLVSEEEPVTITVTRSDAAASGEGIIRTFEVK